MATKSLFLSGEYLYTFFLIYFILFNSFLPSSLFLLFLCSLIHTFLLFPISSLRFFSRPLLENTHKTQSAIYYKSMTAHIIIVFVLNQALTFGSRRWGLGEGGRGRGDFFASFECGNIYHTEKNHLILIIRWDNHLKPR